MERRKSLSCFKMAAGILVAALLSVLSMFAVRTWAMDVIDADVSEPDAGNVFLGLEGRYYADDQDALDRINEIRLEACTAGNVPDPRDPSRMLSADDYVPIKWSSDLERIARVRAYESALTIDHARLNGKTIWTVYSNGLRSTGEVLAWNWSNTMVSGVNQWYREKTDWVEQNSTAVTGHYTSMINPNNKYVGLGDFYSTKAQYYNTVSGEFSQSSAALDQTMLSGTDTILQKVEVKPSDYITGFHINEDSVVRQGEQLQVELTADVYIEDDFGGTTSVTLPVLGGVQYQSSDTEVATVDADGLITTNAAGETTIQAIIDEDNQFSFDLQVGEKSPLTDFWIEDIELMEGTSGFVSDMSPTGGKVWWYDLDNNNSLVYHMTYDGKDYVGTKYEILDQRYLETGEWDYSFFNGIVFSDNQHLETWVGGKEYTASAQKNGIECEFTVSILPSPLTELEIEDISIFEGTSGYTTSRWNEETQQSEQFYYYRPGDSGNLKVTAICNGKTYTGNAGVVSRQISSAIGEDVEFFFEDDTDQFSQPWDINETHTMTAWFMGKKVTFNAAIKPMTVESFSVEDVTIYEGTYCNLQKDANTGENYIRYSVNSKVNISFRFDGKDYSGTTSEIGQIMYDLTGSRIVPEVTDEQSYANQWTGGGTYEAKVSFLGEERTFAVKIEKAPFVSMDVEDITVIKDADGSMIYAYDANGNEFTYYRYFYNPAITLKTASGEEYTHPANDNSQGIFYGDEGFIIMHADDQDTNQWDLGTHQATIYCGGLKQTIHVTVVESPVESLTVDPIYSYEGTVLPIDSSMRMPFTVNFKDGTTIRSERPTIQYNGKSYSLAVNRPSAGPWEAGNTYIISVSILGYTTEVPVIVRGMESIELAESNGLKLTIHQTDGETVEANVHNFYVMAASAGNDKYGSLRTDKGVFDAHVYNYYNNDFKDMKVALGNIESNVLASSKWFETNQIAMGMPYISMARGSSFAGIVNKDNIDNIIFATYMYSTSKYVDGWNGSSLVYDADFVKAGMKKVFAITEDFDISLSSYYDAENNTITVPMFGGLGGNVDMEIISTDEEQGMLLYSYLGPDNDMKVLFDDDYKIKSYGKVGENPQPHEHTWGEWEIVTPATTTAEGLKKRVCSECGEEETEVIPKTSRITEFTLQPVSIIENTCGFERREWDDTTGALVSSYFEYSANEFWNLNMDITIDGVRYMGPLKEIEEELEYFEFTMDGQDPSNPWTVGNTYDAVITITLDEDGSSAFAPVKVSIIETPLSDFTIEDYEQVENTGGMEMADPDTSDKYYQYFPQVKSMSVKYNGEVFTGSSYEVSEQLWEASNKQIAIYSMIVSSTTQSSRNPWMVNNTYPVSVTLGKLTTTYNITIVPEQGPEPGEEPYLEGELLWLGTEYWHSPHIGNVVMDELEIISVNAEDPTILKIEKDPGQGTSIYDYILVPLKAGSTDVIVEYSQNGMTNTVRGTYTVKPFPTFLTSLTIDGEAQATDTYTNHNYYDIYSYTGTSPSVKFTIGDGWYLDNAYGFRTDETGSSNIIIKVDEVETGWTFEFPETSTDIYTFYYFVNDMGEQIMYGLRIHREDDPLNPPVPSVEPGWDETHTHFYDENGDPVTGLHNIDTIWYYFDEEGTLFTNGWITVEGARYYADPQTGVLATGWRKIDGTWYCFNGTGRAYADDVVIIGGKLYYFDADGKMRTGWIKVGNTWYYANSGGDLATGWYQSGTTWYYMDPASGKMQTGFVTVGSSTYYMAPSGAMMTGWIKDNDSWYFTNSSGAIQKGWVKDGSTWYYMDPTSGKMQTGWVTIGSAKYYMASSGAMQTGWVKDGDNWYFANDSGAIQTGWVKVGTAWYYMDSEGIMQTGWVTIGSSKYYMASSGAMVTGWLKDGTTWYYMNSSGAMATGWVKVGNSWYYMKADGAMAAGEWVTGYYWIGANGVWTYQPVGSWKSNSAGRWFGDSSGWYAKNETLKIDDVLYTFDANGYLVEENAVVNQ